MSKNLFYIRDSVWDSVYHPLWKTVLTADWLKSNHPAMVNSARSSVWHSVWDSVENSVRDSMEGFLSELIQEINNE